MNRFKILEGETGLLFRAESGGDLGESADTPRHFFVLRLAILMERENASQSDDGQTCGKPWGPETEPTAGARLSWELLGTGRLENQ